MARLVSKAELVPTNIKRFLSEVATDKGMQSRLAYNRAWYAEPQAGGGWLLGPSKFIGYVGMTAALYDPQNLNGRETERQLGQWYTRLQPSDPLFPEIDQALRDLLAQYGKAPSALYRINISNERYAEMIGVHTDSQADDLAKLLIAVARRLPKPQREQVRAAL